MIPYCVRVCVCRKRNVGMFPESNDAVFHNLLMRCSSEPRLVHQRITFARTSLERDDPCELIFSLALMIKLTFFAFIYGLGAIAVFPLISVAM